MTVNSSSYRPTYFREINNKEEEIELQYSLTFPQGLYLELVADCFRKAIDANSLFVIISTNFNKQEFFTKRMMERYQGETYSHDEMDLTKIMLKIMKKSQKQVNHELKFFNLTAEISLEMVMQESAKIKCDGYEKLNFNAEVLTIRQVKHLVALVDGFGRRSYKSKGYYALTLKGQT